MRKIRLLIEYEGTNYVGWQTQPNGIAIQQVLESELHKITGARVKLHASGRTDSGVHARAQVAHFDTPVRMPADKFAHALNAGLPGDIRVHYSDEVREDFHARFDVTRKQYRYTIQTGEHAHVFLRHTALHAHGPLNEARMAEAARDVLGRHDFVAFMCANSTLTDTVREVVQSDWTREGELLHYDVAGSGFLYNMVRILVGTMLAIGREHLPVDAIKRAIQSGNRNDAGPTAPAHGLTLTRVVYPGFDTEHVLANK